MAREMVLVPLAQWNRLLHQVQQNQVSPQGPPQGLPQGQQHLHQAQLELHQAQRPDMESEMNTASLTEIQEPLPEVKLEDEIIDLLPKSYQVRAKIILHYLKLNLDPNKRVIFDDGSVGAHLLDYLRFILNPLHTAVQPVGTDKFAALLHVSGVPRSVYSVHVEKTQKWLTF